MRVTEEYFVPVAKLLSLCSCSSIVNVPGESTLRRDFIRLQQENKERSEALRRQQLLQEQQLREQEEYKRQLLAERQKRIEQQKEQRRRLEEVGEERPEKRDDPPLSSCSLVYNLQISHCNEKVVQVSLTISLSFCPPLLALYSNNGVSER